MEFFNQTKGITSLKDKFDYVKNHYKYYTMNSWNRLWSIANNVKIYNLGLSSEQKDKAYDFIYCENFYDEINFLIEDSNLNVGFNGRNGGYLVLYHKENNRCAVDNCFYDFSSYKDFLSHEKRGRIFSNAQADCRYIIEQDFELVKSFDILCDEIRATFIDMIENCNIITEEYTTTHERKVIV